MEALACAKTAFTHIIRRTENRRPCIKPQLRSGLLDFCSQRIPRPRPPRSLYRQLRA
jgi:hypothetical protein